MHFFCVCTSLLLGRTDEAGGCGESEGWRSSAEGQHVSHDEDPRNGAPGWRSALRKKIEKKEEDLLRLLLYCFWSRYLLREVAVEHVALM